MPEETTTHPPLTEKAAALLERPLLARLATASPRDCQPHVVPVWFLWDGAQVWISSYRSTRKVRMLEENPRCAVVVDTVDAEGRESGVLFEGQAELVTGPDDFLKDMITRVYVRYLGEDGVLAPDPQEWIHSPENLLIKLVPAKTMSW